MRTRKSLQVLAVAGQALLADAESLVDPAEEERILARIVATDRSAVRRRRPLALGLVAAVAIGVVAAAVVTHGHAVRPSTPRQSHVALTGARIQLAGYHFRTPAGFKANSDTSCGGTGTPLAVGGFVAAASADGGCVAAYLVSASETESMATADGQSVDVCSFQGYYESQASGDSSLYVVLPAASQTALSPYNLVLFARNLTEDQLMAVAESGLSAVNYGAMPKNGTVCS
ncbi:MAG TPA: hypothetical protein VMU72_03805 [Gaiellaceae bacterium]|nr:hypothetical protein [Gaiellaceae bacterium]